MSRRQGIMLCYPFEEKRLTTWRTPYIIQPKLDGDRCRVIIGDGLPIMYTSEGNLITSVPHITESLINSGLHNIELDGELYCHMMPHEELHSRVSRTVNQHEASEDVQLHVFDIIAFEEQARRISRLYDIRCQLESDGVRVVESSMVYTFTEIMEKYYQYLANGYEGFVLRNAYAPYLQKRVTTMLKFKPKKSDIYRIVGVQEEVSITGVKKGTLGALICDSGYTNGTTFNVGTGFSADQRRELWLSRESVIGKWVRVAYQHLTTTGRVPRFPVFTSIVEVGEEL